MKGNNSLFTFCIVCSFSETLHGFSLSSRFRSVRNNNRFLLNTRFDSENSEFADLVSGGTNDKSDIPGELPEEEEKWNIFKDTLKKLAAWSLEDYKWRLSLFKTNEAERMVEESLARMRGENPSYVRPMDATEGKIGPLGEAERAAVDWLSRVIEEEARRAEKIKLSEGMLVRPIDASEEGGPLANLERLAVDFLNRIKDSERERVSTKTLRPKDLDLAKRGPLGDAEAKVSETLEVIRQSEMLRYQLSKRRGGETVRPINVPGPLGEFEKAVANIMRSEQTRVREARFRNVTFVRPMDASVRGPLGEAEIEAVNVFQRLAEEERERLRNIQRLLADNRPMETNLWSLFGFLEAFIVGILRAPAFLQRITEQIQEFLQNPSALLAKQEEQVLAVNASRYVLKMPLPELDVDIGEFE